MYSVKNGMGLRSQKVRWATFEKCMFYMEDASEFKARRKLGPEQDAVREQARPAFTPSRR